MANDNESAAPEATPDAAKDPKAVVGKKSPPAATNNQGTAGLDTSAHDTIGNKKGTTDAENPLGPRGVNVPHDVELPAKPAPTQDNGTTTSIDSAGNKKTDDLPAIGPRGGSASHCQETFVVDKHRK